MPTYNLISGQLHDKRNGQDCFCALGVYANAKGYSIEDIRRNKRYDIFDEPEHAANVKTMLHVLRDYYNSDEVLSPNDCTGVFLANDASTDGRYTTPVEKIWEALAAVGVEVELNDVRGQW